MPSKYFQEAVKEILETLPLELRERTSFGKSIVNTQPSSPTPQYIRHLVVSGDTISSLCKKYGISIAKFKKWNGLKPDNDIIVLSKKYIVGITAPIYHEAQKGDSILKIVKLYSISQSDFIKWNDLKSDIIYLGEKYIVGFETEGETDVPVQSPDLDSTKIKESTIDTVDVKPELPDTNKMIELNIDTIDIKPQPVVVPPKPSVKPTKPKEEDKTKTLPTNNTDVTNVTPAQDVVDNPVSLLQSVEDLFTITNLLTALKNKDNSRHDLIYNLVIKKCICYHVYWNTEKLGKIEKTIPQKISSSFKDKIIYFYYDKNGKRYFVAILDSHEIVPRTEVGKKRRSIPNGYVGTYKYPNGGDAGNAYVYADGEIYVDGTPKYGIVSYELNKKSSKITLVRMPDSLSINESSFKIVYLFYNSQRRYCNPECFAGYIGALADISFNMVYCTGMCFYDGTCYPSTTHPNGDSADTLYFSNYNDELKKVNAFLKFHFEDTISGSSSWYAKLPTRSHNLDHDTHFHGGGFNSKKVIIKKT